ncbi:MAG: efflux RND transporter periplasmic adaptor subunit [Rhodocyclaceae bacterium]|jgi:RND family efflux transporter MFP subunit|nr:efflux RND transporter periplasmic adaptor subunit [Rhodocyclaceae bacterium]
MTKPSLIPAGLLLAAAFVLAPQSAQAAEDIVASRPALTVQATLPREVVLPLRVAANGNIQAWQEAMIGAETQGLRLAEVRVNVGDRVRKGQLLAVFAAETVEADQAEAQARLAEALAHLEEAKANARRGRDLLAKGFISPQRLAEYETAESTAAARVEAQRAALALRRQRLEQTRVKAPDDGFISARSATVGAVPGAGEELFRLIRQGRLEWRAEVAAPDLARLKTGMVATVIPSGGEAVAGRVRMVAPTVDAQTRNGLVYVDLPDPGTVRAGMFARGEFEVGSARGLTLPLGAVVTKEGFSYVMRIGADGRVSQAKVTTGRRVGDLVEILGGLEASVRVVASGGAFLAEGDLVRVVEAAPATPAR